MVGGVFDRPCAGLGCVDGLEGHTNPDAAKGPKGQLSYIVNGQHYGGAQATCCSCCYVNGQRCPHGYGAFVIGKNPDGTNETECRPNGEAKYWVPQHLFDDHAPEGHFGRCYCGCCPCYPEQITFDVVKCEVWVQGERKACRAKDVEEWSFTMKNSLNAECYATQAMGQWKLHQDPCGQFNFPINDNSINGVCHGPSLNKEMFDNPEYVEENSKINPKASDKPSRRGKYEEGWGYNGEICKRDSNESEQIPNRPAFPFFSAKGGMNIYGALCCCKTGNVTIIPELPNNISGEPEDRIVDSSRTCIAAVGNPVPANQNPNPAQPHMLLASCPGDNQAFGKVFDNAPTSFLTESLKKTGYELHQNTMCSLDCFRFTLFPDPINKQPIFHNFQPLFKEGLPHVIENVTGWYQLWGVNGIDCTAICTPCSKKMMKFYHPENDNEKVCNEDRQDKKNNAFKAFDLTKLPPQANADHEFAQAPGHHAVAKAAPNLQAINHMGSHRLLHGECKTGGSEFTLTVTGSFDIACDCQTGLLPCYRNAAVFAGDFPNVLMTSPPWPDGDGGFHGPDVNNAKSYGPNCPDVFDFANCHGPYNDPYTSPGGHIGKDCAPSQDWRDGACTNCVGESMDVKAINSDGHCQHGFHNAGGVCWPSSDYQTYVRLNYIAELSDAE